jgi:hypothetical protein
MPVALHTGISARRQHTRSRARESRVPAKRVAVRDYSETSQRGTHLVGSQVIVVEQTDPCGQSAVLSQVGSSLQVGSIPTGIRQTGSPPSSALHAHVAIAHCASFSQVFAQLSLSRHCSPAAQSDTQEPPWHSEQGPQASPSPVGLHFPFLHFRQGGGHFFFLHFFFFFFLASVAKSPSETSAPLSERVTAVRRVKCCASDWTTASKRAASISTSPPVKSGNFARQADRNIRTRNDILPLQWLFGKTLCFAFVKKSTHGPSAIFSATRTCPPARRCWRRCDARRRARSFVTC